MEKNLTPAVYHTLVLEPGVRIDVSTRNGVGGGARDPKILFNEKIRHSDRHMIDQFGQDQTFDTFRGRGAPSALDWYAIIFPQAQPINCIEMTMGLPYRDGGWWTSLNVEVQREAGQPWQAVSNLHITPNYPFSDSRANRKPFETYLLRFDNFTACAVRMIGVPGGLEKFTSLARLAVYQRDFSRWNPLDLPEPPIPHVFRLISPSEIYDLSESLTKVTGLDITFPMLEYFLDEERFGRYWARMLPNYMGQPQLWILMGDTIGWNQYNKMVPTFSQPITTRLRPQPSINIHFHGVLASATAPLVVDDQHLGSLFSGDAVLSRDMDLHARLAAQYGIPWETYRAALDRSPFMTIEQMEGVAELIGMIANSIARLAHRAFLLENELNKARSSARSDSDSARETVQRAIRYMQDHLEEDISAVRVAEAVCLNPSYFSTFFSSQVGVTPTEFLTQLRLERAKEYLGQTNMSVMEVCVALGYTPSYFNRLFKKATGMPPGEYARKARQTAAADESGGESMGGE